MLLVQVSRPLRILFRCFLRSVLFFLSFLFITSTVFTIVNPFIISIKINDLARINKQFAVKVINNETQSILFPFRYNKKKRRFLNSRDGHPTIDERTCHLMIDAQKRPRLNVFVGRLSSDVADVIPNCSEWKEWSYYYYWKNANNVVKIKENQQ